MTGKNITTVVIMKTRSCHLFAVMIALLLLLPCSSASGMGLGGTDPTVFFPFETQIVSEAGTSATVMVQLSATASSDVIVPFTVTGTALGDGIDYTLPSSSVTIVAGDLSADIPLTLTADTMDEPDETVIITLGEPTDAVLGTATVHTLSITDGDLPPVIPVDDAVMPDYQNLPFASKTFSSPTDVAIGPDGSVYVVDSYANMITRLSQGGNYIDSLGGLANPTCVAVDGNGTIYVGNKDRGNVEVYDPDFNFLFKLGSGDGEFKQPRDIAIDSSGTVYVVDMKSNSVSFYDSSGNYGGLLGGPGDGGGEFHLPLSIAIDEITEKIIVLDRSYGARVQFFDNAGTYLGCFYKYSSTIGGLIRPQYITVDKEHRLYVTDSAQNVILVYDTGGNYLGAVYNTQSPERSPLGMTLSGNNKLYVASRVSNKVEVYGIDDFIHTVAGPDELSFTAKSGDVNPPPQQMIIRNSGTTTLTWGAATTDGWISLSDESGVLEQGQIITPEVAVDITGFTPGKYSSSITVSPDSGSTEVVQIVLTVLPAIAPVPAARLFVTPGTVSFSSTVGITPYPETITIANTGSAPLDWFIQSDMNWISIPEPSGTIAAGANDVNVALFADISSLAAGTYTGTIAVFSPKAFDNTALIDVTLILTDSTPGSSPTPPPGTTWSGNNNRKWKVLAQTDGTSLNSIWGSSSADIFAVGDNGMILHYDGLDWNEEGPGISLALNGVWGASPSSVYAVGESGLLLHYDGETWNDSSSLFMGVLQNVWCNSGLNCVTVGQNATILANTDLNNSWGEEYSLENYGSLQGVWGLSESDIYVVGDFGVIIHYDGSQWTSADIETDEHLYDVWGSAANNIYAVGQNGTILHYNGTSWLPMESGTTVTLTGIWGNAANDVYAVGDDGTMLLYTGSMWNKLETGITEDLNDAWASREKEIYAVGSDGSIIFGWTSFPWQLFLPVLHPSEKQVPLQQGNKQ